MNAALSALDALLANSSCTQLYIDAGTNVGVQVRKLYEPQRYNATPDPSRALRRRHPAFARAQLAIMRESLRLLEAALGPPPRCHVCSLGFEPNPLLQPQLRTFEAAMRQAGAGVAVVYGGVAASDGHVRLSYPASAADLHDSMEARLVDAAPGAEDARLAERLHRGTEASTVVPTFDLARVVNHAASRLARRSRVRWRTRWTVMSRLQWM